MGGNILKKKTFSFLQRLNLLNKDDRKGGELEMVWEKQIQKTDRKKMEEVIQQKFTQTLDEKVWVQDRHRNKSNPFKT